MLQNQCSVTQTVLMQSMHDIQTATTKHGTKCCKTLATHKTWFHYELLHANRLQKTVNSSVREMTPIPIRKHFNYQHRRLSQIQGSWPDFKIKFKGIQGPHSRHSRRTALIHSSIFYQHVYTGSVYIRQFYDCNVRLPSTNMKTEVTRS